MNRPNFRTSYERHASELVRNRDTQSAMSLVVGGDFEAVGKLECALLLQYGLDRSDTVVDVGCGSGRLGFQLRNRLKGRYIGIDVVRDLFEYAQRICERPDWSFYEAPGLSIPEESGSADFICFFSVFTHLLHEESYRYLADAARVIKPKGRILISFLEFAIPSHWTVFEQDLADQRQDKVLNQFLGRDALEAWAGHLGLEIVDFHDGDKPHIRLDDIVTWDDGREMSGHGSLGQSVCVLTRP